MTEVIVGTATRSTYKMAANLTQFLNFKANFYQECKLFSKIKMFANNGGHFKIVSIIKKNYICLGEHTKVRVPGATIARKNTCVINKLIDHTSVPCSM